MSTYVWQGHAGGPDGDCPERSPGPSGGWACTLKKEHKLLHEAWGTTGTSPIYVWGHARMDDPHMQYEADRDALHIQVDSDAGMEALSRMLDEALTEDE